MIHRGECEHNNFKILIIKEFDYKNYKKVNCLAVTVTRTNVAINYVRIRNIVQISYDLNKN